MSKGMIDGGLNVCDVANIIAYAGVSEEPSVAFVREMRT